MEQKVQPHWQVMLMPDMIAQATTKEGLDAVKAQLKGYSKGMEVSVLLHQLTETSRLCSPEQQWLLCSPQASLLGSEVCIDLANYQSLLESSRRRMWQLWIKLGLGAGLRWRGRCVQDGKAEAQVQIEALESAKRKLERKMSALTAKSSALKEANAAQAVTVEGLQANHDLSLKTQEASGCSIYDHSTA